MVSLSEKNEKVVIPEELPILHSKSVVFPYMVIPLFFSRKRDIDAINSSMMGNHLIGLVAQKKEDIEDPRIDDLYGIGTAVQVLQIMKLPDGNVKVLVEGLSRIRITEYIQEEPYLIARVENLREFQEKTLLVEALMSSIIALFKVCVSLGRGLPEDVIETIDKVGNPARLADLIGVYLELKLNEQQELLETVDPQERLKKVFLFLNKEVQLLQVKGKIQTEVTKELGKTQREYILRQQLKAIQKELGEEDDQTSEIAGLKKKIKEAKLPDYVYEVVQKELDRLEKMHPASAEYTVCLTYIDWLITIPWEKKTEDNLDINQAAKILDEDHYGLKKVKERVLEYLAVRTLKEKMKGPILCFVGPPGVGKTSLGKSIARSLGRRFIRISLGGIKDEAEIRGHRRTYVGSLPGRIIQNIRRAGSCNPVFMLDEIDKIGQDFRGDPASALLEALDPEQNFDFSDHYLDIPFDLSKVIFITTANLLDPIPPALKDRMEVIYLSGYTEEEKLKIAEKFLIPKQITENGLEKHSFKLSATAVQKIIREYTREAGLRNLERKIASICRKIAKKLVQKNIATNIVTAQSIQKYLGPRKFFFDVAEGKDRIGVATGLAWTQFGGDILFIEVTKMKGQSKLTLTGQLGDVMQESAQAALSYVRSNSKNLNIDENFFDNYEIHIHVPSGATPKDGPSAGVTIATALISLLTEKPVHRDVAMTGEITLTGNILPVGGIKEKTLAARRAGVKTVVLPAKNETDLQEIPNYLKKELKFIFIEKVEDALDIALNKK